MQVPELTPQVAAIVSDAIAQGAKQGVGLVDTAPVLAENAFAAAVRKADSVDKLRVLIYSADLGGGHDAMANAIKGELLTRFPDMVDVQVANGLQIGDPLLHRVMRDGYAAQLKYAPGSYGVMYELASHGPVAKFQESVSRWMTASRLGDDIARREPDVVVSTFPQLTGTLGHMRADGKLKVPAIGVVIDSDPHRQWVHPGIDEHLVLNPDDIPRIASFGTRKAPIDGRVIRPPVDSRSFEPYDVAAVRDHFGLPQDQKVVMVSGGQWGLGLPEADLRRILDETDLHLAIATGRNEQALAHLQANFPADRVTPIGFTREMPKLLAASDAVLTNSSGMTTMETFARGRPVILFGPVPGHGVDGATALAEDGLATYARTTDDAIGALHKVAAGDDPDLLARVARARALFDDGERASDIVMDAARVGNLTRTASPT